MGHEIVKYAPEPLASLRKRSEVKLERIEPRSSLTAIAAECGLLADSASGS